MRGKTLGDKWEGRLVPFREGPVCTTEGNSFFPL